MIDAARGAKVRAPFFGRVVYADWLQGLGLLMIIGHSGGYMTLYGHAEVLYKSVGDWVAPGDVIAALSDSEGANPQLYFEIREGRKTVDPKLWLRLLIPRLNRLAAGGQPSAHVCSASMIKKSGNAVTAGRRHRHRPVAGAGAWRPGRQAGCARRRSALAGRAHAGRGAGTGKA